MRREDNDAEGPGGGGGGGVKALKRGFERAGGEMGGVDATLDSVSSFSFSFSFEATKAWRRSETAVSGWTFGGRGAEAISEAKRNWGGGGDGTDEEGGTGRGEDAGGWLEGGGRGGVKALKGCLELGGGGTEVDAT